MTHALKQAVPALLWMLTLVSLATSAAGRAAQANCRVLYAPGNGWVIDLCANDSAITTPMTIVLDGIAQGNAALVRIYHASQTGPTTPQVAVIYASGFIRLKQNADPSLAIPFGSSFILGPAYWPTASTYHHNPQLRRLAIDTSWLASGPLRMRAEGSNQQFDVDYEMALPPARDRQTRLHVTQTYTATANIAIDPTRRAERQGFKLVQVSSMFINQGGTCGGGNTDCHDSNAARYLGADRARHQVVFNSLSLPSFIYSMPQPLSSTWLDALHTDDTGWQGNTPNDRIALDVLPADRTITPQGWISATTNPNDDNVSLWLHDDGPASQAWQVGQRAQISYWLLAQDDPPEPWVDLNLRSGSTFLDFESSSNCFPAASGPPVISTIAPIAGYTNSALQLRYNLGSASGNWAQVRCDFTSPLDLSAYDHLRIDWQGTTLISNSLELGLVARHGADQAVTFFRQPINMLRNTSGGTS